MKLREKFIVLFFIGICSTPHLATAQSQEKAYALLMVNFIKGIQWPGNPSNEKFILGVLEYPPLAAELNAALLTSRTGKQVVVKEFDSPNDINKCDMLFIPAYKSRQLTTLTEKLKDKPTLFVTNKLDLARKGSHINFVIIDGKLRYEINCKSIEQRGMKVASNIRGLGIIVE